MADLKTEIQFTTTLTQKEFSVMTRSLAGHELKGRDLVLARELNERLLRLRYAQIEEYTRQAARALVVAREEMETHGAESLETRETK